MFPFYQFPKPWAPILHFSRCDTDWLICDWQLYTALLNFWMVSCSQVSYCSVNAKYLDSECNGPCSSWSLLRRYCPFLLLPTKLTLQRGSTFCCVLPLSVLWQLEQTCWANSLDKYKEIHPQTFPAERWKLVKYLFGSASSVNRWFCWELPSAVFFLKQLWHKCCLKNLTSSQLWCHCQWLEIQTSYFSEFVWLCSTWHDTDSVMFGWNANEMVSCAGQSKRSKEEKFNNSLEGKKKPQTNKQHFIFYLYRPPNHPL